jgi:hypothetical protein
MLKILGVAIFASLIITAQAQKFTFNDSIIVQAKVWNKNKEKKVTYSDWKPNVSHTIGMISHFDSSQADENIDVYGGSPIIKSKGTGYFRVDKINNRFWFIDPLGNSYFNTAINGIRPGTSSNTMKSLNDHFGNLNNWISDVHKQIKSYGFNSAGSWSDVNTINAYNKSNKTPLPYCTQLSILSTFKKENKIKNENKDYPILAYVYNPLFEYHCKNKILENKNKFYDPNLLGHFSDNELPFQENILTQFLDINDESDEAFQFANNYVSQNNINVNDISKGQQEKFAGLIAEKYFSTVNRILKTHDPNHLYLGSRLHSSAKNNKAVLHAAEKNMDVISINFYGHWDLRPKEDDLWAKLKKPFIITEFYTKGDDTKMDNMSGAGWRVSTQADRGIHYQNFLLSFMQNKNCIGIHWFRYQDNDPKDTSADPSNLDSNKGMVNVDYEWYTPLVNAMSQINNRKFRLIKHLDNIK